MNGPAADKYMDAIIFPFLYWNAIYPIITHFYLNIVDLEGEQ